MATTHVNASLSDPQRSTSLVGNEGITPRIALLGFASLLRILLFVCLFVAFLRVWLVPTPR